MLDPRRLQGDFKTYSHFLSRVMCLKKVSFSRNAHVKAFFPYRLLRCFQLQPRFNGLVIDIETERLRK